MEGTVSSLLNTIQELAQKTKSELDLWDLDLTSRVSSLTHMTDALAEAREAERRHANAEREWKERAEKSEMENERLRATIAAMNKAHGQEIKKLKQALNDEKQAANSSSSKANSSNSSSSSSSTTNSAVSISSTAILNDSMYRQKLLALKMEYDRDLAKLKQEMRDLRNEIEKSLASQQ